MSNMLEEHEGTVSIAGRIITNQQFSDGIDGLALSEHELAHIIERLHKHQLHAACISAPKNKK